MSNNTTKILIADDDKDYLKKISQVFEALGYEVIVTDKGRKVSKLVCKKMPDLLILDVMMVDKNGYQVIDCVNELCPGTLTIFMTGHASADSAIKALKSGAYDNIRKPFNALIAESAEA